MGAELTKLGADSLRADSTETRAVPLELTMMGGRVTFRRQRVSAFAAHREVHSQFFRD